MADVKDFTEQKKIYAQWLSMPRKIRQPQTLQGLAKHLGVHYNTLTNWKGDEQFAKDVEVLRRKRIVDSMSDLYESAIENAIKGNHNYFKLLLELVNDTFAKQTIVFEEVKTKTTEDLVDRMRQLTSKGGFSAPSAKA